jgi:cholesterol oxidase
MPDIQAIVIGSGFGGAVAALRLGQAGIETLVLERGRRWTIEDPTRNATFATFEKPDGRAEWLASVTQTPGYEGTAIEVYPGVLEVLPGQDLTFLAGAGVGGGSLVYGGILIQPPGELFKQVFPSAIDYDEMDTVYYPRVRSVIKTAPIPDDILDTDYFAGLRVLRDHALKAGFPYEDDETDGGDHLCKLKMAVDWDVVREEIAGTKVPSLIMAQFWYGNNSGAKQTLDRDYLKSAEESGSVEIRPLHVVTDIAEAVKGGYRVSYALIDEAGAVVQRQTLTCEYLFLAAGTFGTCQLLLKGKAKGKLPRLNEFLGHGFGNDGDVFLQRGDLSEITNPHLGGAGCLAVCNYRNPRQPCVMMRAPLPRFANDFPAGNALGSIVLAMTPKRGHLTYDATTDALQVHFIPDADDAARLLAERLNEANGGRLLATVSKVSGHQLGGACMGQVCDTSGRVARYRKLYVVDGALIPGSTTCVNPALTIAAIAERCMDDILTEDMKR